VSKRKYKTMIVPCKRCIKELKLHLPMHIYEMFLAAAEERGETVAWTGTCRSCREDDPFLRMLDKANIPTIGRDFTEEV
jgi:hypothetical protein